MAGRVGLTAQISVQEQLRAVEGDLSGFAFG